MNGEVMLAEMAEQPLVLARLAARWEDLKALVATHAPRPLAGITFVARGSSDNAAVLGRYLVEMAARRPASLAAPSIITRYDASVDYRGWLAVALSQSGATPEVVAVIRAMHDGGAATVGVSNELECPLRDAVDLFLCCDAGPELAVPATKTVTAQMVMMAMLAAALGPVPYRLDDLAGLHFVVAALLDDVAPVRHVGDRWANTDRLFVVGRGVLYAAALETALKVKETTGILAEGLSTADLLHGPVAAVGPGTPVLLLDGGGPTSRDIAAVAELLTTRHADVVRLSPDPDAQIPLLASVPEALHAVTATVRGQQLAHALAMARGMDPDRPRGLSKVTATS
jgi:glucosamine--fructose-6-phosphate aminotransferase (isomerizing)